MKINIFSFLFILPSTFSTIFNLDNENNNILNLGDIVINNRKHNLRSKNNNNIQSKDIIKRYYHNLYSKNEKFINNENILDNQNNYVKIENNLDEENIIFLF